MPSDDEFPPLPERRWQGAPVRYPDPAVRTLDPRFEELRVDSAAVERLATGCRWAEGPVWFGDHDCLVWSDIPNNRMLRWDARSGEVSTFRSPSHFANGNTRDREGRLVTCEHWTRRVTRTEHDGTVAVLMDAYEGKPLNAPNDVVVRSDGSVWFTDPGYGTLLDYEGERGSHELETAVYLLDPASGAAQAVITELERPNGLCFSPDESLLYVVNSGGAGTITAYPVDPDGTVSHGEVFAELKPGGPDGIRCDEHGNVWAAASGGGDGFDGVHVFAPDGTRIGQILLPEQCANLTFGGRFRTRLFMTASQSVYSVFVRVRGLG